MSSLSAFLETMYKKRALEYEAKVNQAKADVAGAEAIGSGIASIGNAVGKIGSGIGGYMQQSQADKVAMSIGREEGVPLTSTGFGAERELEMRMKAGQIGGQDQGLTAYQQLQQQNSNRNFGLELEKENRRRQEYLDRRSDAGTRGATKSYTDTVANTDAYQANSAANMAKLYDANTPEAFSVFQSHQTSLNQGAVKAGVDPEIIKKYAVPQEFVPKTTSYDEMPASYRRYPEPSYAPSIGMVNQRTTGANIPPGALPAAGFQGPQGATGKINGKPYKFDGTFWVPNL